MSDTALLIIDLQNDYFPRGTMELEGSDAACKRAAEALAAFRAKKLPVFHVQHLSVRPGATFFIPGTKGAEIHEGVRPAQGEAVVQKNFPNSFRATDLKHRLDAAGVKHLVVAGMMTHMCVNATVRQAADQGYRVTLMAYACATRALKHGEESGYDKAGARRIPRTNRGRDQERELTLRRVLRPPRRHRFWLVRLGQSLDEACAQSSYLCPTIPIEAG